MPNIISFSHELEVIKAKVTLKQGEAPCKFDYSREAQARRQYRPVVKCYEVNHLGEVIFDGFSMMKEVYPRKIFDEIIHLYTQLGMFKLLNYSTFLSFCGDIGDLMKTHGNVGSTNWRYYVDTNHMADFHELDNNDLLHQLTIDWVSEPRVHTLNGSEEDFLTAFEAGVTRASQIWQSSCREPKSSEIVYGFKKWIGDISKWALSGASTGKKLSVQQDDFILNAMKSKWATAVAIDEQDINNLADYMIPHNISNASKKRELGKVRLVITSNLELYLQSAYLSQWLDKWLHTRTCSLFWSGSETLKYRLEDVKRCREKWFAWPIDQKNFDHQVNLKMVKIGLTALFDIVKSNYGEGREGYDEMLQIQNAVLMNMTTGFIKTPLGLVKHNNGILSGWRWTSILDSIVNLGEFLMMQNCAQGLGYCLDDNVDCVAVQGDDLNTWYRFGDDIIAMSYFWENTGFIINKAKTFLDMGRNEYLRLVTTDNLVVGYPARCLASILWRNPKGEIIKPGDLRVASRVGKWCKAINRGCVEYMCMLGMKRDIHRGDKLSMAEIDHLLMTEKTFGGFGIVKNYDLNKYSISTSVPHYSFKYKSIPWYKRISTKLSQMLIGVEPNLSDWFGTRVAFKHSERIQIKRSDTKILVKKNDIWMSQETNPRWYEYRDCGTAPLKFQSKDLGDLNPLKEVITKELLDQKNFSKLYDIATNKSMQWLAVFINNASARVLREWLVSGIKLSLGYNKGVDDAAVSQICNDFAEHIWYQASYKSNIGYDEVVRSSLITECGSRDIVSDFIKVTGVVFAY